MIAIDRLIDIPGKFLKNFWAGWSDAERERITIEPAHVCCEVSEDMFELDSVALWEIHTTQVEVPVETEEIVFAAITMAILEPPTEETRVPGCPGNENRGDAVEALVALGYGKRISAEAIGWAEESCSPKASVEDLIKAALKYLAPKDKKISDKDRGGSYDKGVNRGQLHR